MPKVATTTVRTAATTATEPRHLLHRRTGFNLRQNRGGWSHRHIRIAMLRGLLARLLYAAESPVTAHILIGITTAWDANSHGDRAGPLGRRRTQAQAAQSDQRCAGHAVLFGPDHRFGCSYVAELGTNAESAVEIIRPLATRSTDKSDTSGPAPLDRLTQAMCPARPAELVGGVGRLT
jgi:hypothetical protein